MTFAPDAVEVRRSLDGAALECSGPVALRCSMSRCTGAPRTADPVIASEAKQSSFVAEPVIGPATSGRTRWLFAMTMVLLLRIVGKCSVATAQRLCHPSHRGGVKSRITARCASNQCRSKEAQCRTEKHFASPKTHVLRAQIGRRAMGVCCVLCGGFCRDGLFRLAWRRMSARPPSSSRARGDNLMRRRDVF